MMNRIVKWKKHSLYIKIIALNVVFTILFSSILLYNSYYLKDTVKQNMEQTNKDSLLNVAGNMDQQFYKLKRSVYSLSMDTDMISINKSDDNSTGYQMMLRRFNQKLTQLGRLLPFESSIFVYFQEKGFVTSGNGTRQLSLFYEKLRQESADFTCNCLHTIEQTESFHNYDQFMTYVYRINNVGAVIVKINKSGLERDLQQSALILGNMMWITTANGEVVAGNDLLTPELKQGLQSDDPTFFIEGKTYSSIHVALNGLKYTVLYPESILQTKISHANQYTLMLFLIFLVISIGLLAMNMTIYSPIKSTMSKLHSSNQSMLQALNQQHTIMEQNALLRLVSDPLHDIPPDLLQSLYTKYRTGYILTFFIEADHGAHVEYACKKLEQYLSEHYTIQKLIHPTGADTYLMYNMNPHDLSSSLRSILEATASEGYFIMCGISGYMTDIRNIHRAVQESTQAIDQAPYTWDASFHIANYKNHTHFEETSIALSIDKEQELIAYTLKGNQESLQHFFSSTIRNLMKRMTYQDIRTLQRYLNDLLHVIISSKKIKVDQLSEPLRIDLSTVRNPEIVHMELYRKYDALAAYSFNQDMTMYDKIVNFIDQNYNRDLSLTVIADEFNITTVYLSSYFKKHSGYNITHYVKNVRMTAALKQLEEYRHLTIKEIAERVGYCSEQTFTRHFKKVFGTTPAQYMKIPLEDTFLE